MMQEKDELLSQLSLNDVLLNFSNALNNVWQNLVKINPIAFDDWDEFVNDFWTHLVVKTLSWKFGLTKEELGLATEVSGIGISSGKTKIVAKLKNEIANCWTLEKEKIQLSQVEMQRVELIDITTVGVNLTMYANMIFENVNSNQNELSQLRFPLGDLNQMNFDYAKVEITDVNQAKAKFYIRLSDLDFKLDKR